MKTRYYYIDWIRVLAFGLLILFHTGMFFNTWEWHVKNNANIDGLEFIMLFFNQWRLSLLFFISGAGVSFALKSRTAKAFVGERTRRLFIPLLFGMFVIVPPQIYFERLQSEQFFGSIIQFYPKVLEFVSYPQGNFSWHHLWFLPYLFFYCLIFAPLFFWLRSEKGTKFSEKLVKFSIKPYRILLYAVPFAFVFIWLANKYPVTHNLIVDWYNHAFSALLFVFGYFLGSQLQTWEMLETNRKKYLFISIILTTSLYLISWLPNYGIQLIGFRLNSDLIYAFLKMFNIWAIILTICGYFKHYLNKTNRFIQYATEAVLPFYILHQTITVSVGYYLANIMIPAGIKFVILVLATFLGSWIIYHYIIKPFNVFRLLFGLKRIQNQGAPLIRLQPVMNFVSAILVIYFTFYFFVWAKPASKNLSIRIVNDKPLIDGNTEDLFWKNALIFDEFKTQNPRSGLNPSEKTIVRFAVNKENLYIAIECFDSKISEISHDSLTPEKIDKNDWVAFCINLENDSKNCYFFMVNPQNMKITGKLRLRDGNIEKIEQFEFTSETKFNSSGWFVEMQIPVKFVAPILNDKTVLRFKAARNIHRLHEEVNYPSINPGFPYQVSQFQKVRFTIY